MDQEIVRPHDVLNDSMALLDEATRIVGSRRLEPQRETLKLLGMAIGEILHVRKFICDAEPNLRVSGE
jgi:hypothetical protein